MSVNLVRIGPDNGFSLDPRQAIMLTNPGILLIGSLGTNFSEIKIKIRNFSFMKRHLKMSHAKWRPLCSGRDKLSPLWWQGSNTSEISTLSLPHMKHVPGRQHKIYNISHKIYTWFCCVLFSCGYIVSPFGFIWSICGYDFIVNLYNAFAHIIQGCFTKTGEIIWLPKCLSSNPEEYR